MAFKTVCVLRVLAVATLGTDVSRLPALGCETDFQLVIGKRTSAINSSSSC